MYKRIELSNHFVGVYMNYDAVTLEECLIQYELNLQVAIINDGHIVAFEDDTSISFNTVYIYKQP